ncbi:SWI/SNF nucleosome remodeling complex component-like [Octopus sinensis]|uniref:SWI/SNF nucleosome remodeling complex component-like n=1 Tax=Octopus sinensis TaxID=2607531 RepID=A0A7E6EKP0_9MOLL|nr:SWI/SNF nucleosome remodeling complex component-like [Octopus sinensis]
MEGATKLNPSRFYSDLIAFNKSLKSEIVNFPTVNGVSINLFALYNQVTSLGGYRAVSSSNKWNDVANSIGLLGHSLAFPNHLRQIYNRYLEPFEQRGNRDNKLFESQTKREVDMFFTLPMHCHSRKGIITVDIPRISEYL